MTSKSEHIRDADDHYPTPAELVVAALSDVRASSANVYDQNVLDIGAGSGVWGQSWRKAHPMRAMTLTVEGVELRDAPHPLGYDLWNPKTDYLSWHPSNPYDVVIGNPPYKDAEAFVRHGYDMLTPRGGVMVLLLRLAFLEGQARMAGLWKELPPEHVAICGARPSFTANGKSDNSAYAVYYWRKRIDKQIASQPTISWLDWKPAPAPKEKTQLALFNG